jgi:hypothetical protein
MSKQTAVEWLLNELDYETICKFDKQLVQAKEMEREQIIDACLSNKTNHPVIKEIFEIQAEQYYNETYGEQTNSN